MNLGFDSFVLLTIDEDEYGIITEFDDSVYDEHPLLAKGERDDQCFKLSQNVLEQIWMHGRGDNEGLIKHTL